MRKRYDKKFKALVALEAIKGERTIAEIASQYEVHPNQVSKWKKKALQVFPEIFAKGADKKDKSKEQLQEELYRQIGKLKVENEFLKKKYQQIFGK